MNWRQRIGLLASVVVLGSAVPATPALAATTTFVASCEVDITTDGVAAPPITVRGGFQLTGSPSPTVRVGEPVVATGFQARLLLDWNRLAPEMASRGVTHLSGGLLAAWFDWVENGVADWPVPLAGEYPTFPVEQLATGISTVPQDRELRAPAAPGTVQLSNYGDFYVDLHKYDSPQVTVIVHCSPLFDWQNPRYGEVTVLP